MTIPSIALTIPNFGTYLPSSDLAGVVDLAVAAEAAGVDTVIVVDHVVMSENTDAYEWGPFPYTDMTTPWLEPLTVLSAVAGATRTVRLSTGIIIAGLRPAAVLAKTTATLDVLSRGRLDIGVGTGWQKEEYEACGLDFSKRGRILTDTLEACRQLWLGGPVDFESETVSLSNIWCYPTPVQPEGVPVFVSGTLSRNNMDRLIRLADGWIPIMGEDTPGVAAGIAKIRSAWDAAGRDPQQLRVRAPLPAVRNDEGRPLLQQTIESSAQLAEIGVTEAAIAMQPWTRTAEEAEEFLAQLGDVLSEARA
jgi:probable F420-dependent oxidoreductase